MTSEPQGNVIDLKSLFQSGDNSEVFQQKIADSFPAIIYVYDIRQKKLHYINNKLTEILGFSYNDVELWDNEFMKFVFKDDVALVQKELDKFIALKDNDTYTYDSRFNHKEGDWRYFRTQGIVFKRNENGNPASLLFIAQDITQDMQTTEEVRASRKLLNETEQLLRFGTWTWDLITNKVVWSDGLKILLGYSEKDVPVVITHASFMQHVARHDAEALETRIQEAILTRSEFKHVFTVITKNQEKKIVSTLGKVIISSDDSVIKIIGVTSDITEQMDLHTKKQELQDDLARYRELMIEKERTLGFGSLEMDFLKNELKWSDGMYLLFGYDPETDKEKIKLGDELYKMHMSDAELTSAKEKLSEALKSKSNYIIGTPIRTKSGTSKRLETFGKIERQANGSPSKIIGITRDITQLKDYEFNLQHKIEELDRSNKELEEFAYIASHDLQEPLRKITAFSERLQEKANDEMGEEGQLYLQRILAATQNMRLLIDNLLEFSRTSRHNSPFEKVDLNMIFKQVITDLELKIEETNTVVSASSLPAISAIHTQMIQLFTNVLSNSIKFRKHREPQEIKIHCEILPDEEKNNHFLEDEKKYYKIVIHDKGIGFEQEYALKIFHIFHRLHGKAEYPGSGIGLAICKKIVDNHNGIIYAESSPGLGASFNIILPEDQ